MPGWINCPPWYPPLSLPRASESSDFAFSTPTVKLDSRTVFSPAQAVDPISLVLRETLVFDLSVQLLLTVRQVVGHFVCQPPQGADDLTTLWHMSPEAQDVGSIGVRPFLRIHHNSQEGCVDLTLSKSHECAATALRYHVPFRVSLHMRCGFF